MHTISETYTTVMALQDFMPVILSSIGLFLLARMITRMNAASGQVAFIGWLLITLGGLDKASWKLLMASSNSQTNITWLDDSLFILMGIGFLCMAWGLWRSQRVVSGKKRPTGPAWVFPLVVGGLFLTTAVLLGVLMPDKRYWFFIMLGLTTICNVVTSGLAIRQAHQQGLHLVGFLFAFNLVAVFVLTGLARIENRGEFLEWTSQLTNTVSNAAFAFAAWKLSQSIKQSEGSEQLSVKPA
jgi:hypothetical protein